MIKPGTCRSCSGHSTYCTTKAGHMKCRSDCNIKYLSSAFKEQRVPVRELPLFNPDFILRVTLYARLTFDPSEVKIITHVQIYCEFIACNK